MEQKTTTLEGKLGRYSAVAGALITGAAANAQVQYVDLNPDVNVTVATPFMLDMNNDANIDFGFTVVYINTNISYSGVPANVEGNIAGLTIESGNGVMGSQQSFLSGQYNVLSPSLLNTGAPVGPQTTPWSSGGSGLFAYKVDITAFGFPLGNFEGGDWRGENDKYMGVRFKIAGNDHYGWIRLSVAADATTMTIKDYAYQQTADCEINTGQQTGAACPASVLDVSLDSKVSINNNLEFATVNVTPDLIGGTILLHNAMGQVVSETPIADVNTQVQYSNMSTGIYMLSARFDEGQITKKVYVR